MVIKLIQIITKSLFFACIFTALYGLLLGAILVKRDSEYKTRVYPEVYSNAINFEGKETSDVIAYYKKVNDQLAKLQITVSYKDSVATFSGEMLQLHYDAPTIAYQLYNIGRSTNLPTRLIQKYSTLLHLSHYYFVYKPQFSLDEVSAHFDNLNDIYAKEPKDALFEMKNGRVTGFRIEENGVAIDTTSAISSIKRNLLSISEQSIPEGYSISLTDSVLKPSITLSEANQFGILEKIGEGISNYRGSAPERVHNLTQAMTKIHGVLIPPGEVFSYNKTVGDISLKTGYKTGYVIKNGRTVLGDGGGVCQDSTTLFRAALNTGLPIIERKGHAYRVHYYENDRKPGFDATVYAPSVDFKFKNDTQAHILIQGSIDKAKTSLTFTFYGKKDGRRVELSDAKIYDQTSAPQALYEETPTLKRGVTKQVDWSAPGAKSQFSYKVYAASGEVLQDKIFYTNYRPWQAVYLVGTAD